MESTYTILCTSALMMKREITTMCCTPLLLLFLQRGVAPLHLASRHGHAHLVRLLLDHGADINLPSKGGVSALHLASRCGHSAIVELLLDKGEHSRQSGSIIFLNKQPRGSCIQQPRC
jgi:ankyrin repeat protein